MAEIAEQIPAKVKVMSAPKTVEIAITGRCNLNCAYCFYADEMVVRDDLSTERWLAFFDELGRLGVMNVTLTGGEVFTRRDLFTLIDGVIDNRMRYGLLSNGTLITEKTLEQFEIGKRRMRLDSIQISIDGSTEDVHNQSRPKSFARAVRGLRLLKEAGYPVTVRVTVNRHNVDDLENIAKLLLDDLGLPEFSTNEAFPCGATNRHEGGIRLSPAQRAQAMRVLSDLSQRYDGRISATAGPLSVAHDFERIDAALAAGQTCFPGHGTLSACGGVFGKIAVMHDGTIVPCHLLPTLRVGNVQTDSLGQVWREHETMNAMRLRRQIPLGKLETCKDCKYQGFCTGSCPAGAVLLGYGLGSRNPYDCYRVLRSEDPYFSSDVDIPSTGIE